MAEVNGHIPVTIQPQNIQYESISRNSESGNQLNNLASNEVDYRIPYELIIELPKPRYERNIVERDEMGRIVHSKPPEMPL